MEKMDELLAKYMLGETTSAEIKLINEWMNASDNNLKYFNHFKQIWDTAAALKVESKLDVDKSWTTFRQQADHIQPEAQVRYLNTRWLKLAAACVLIICAAGLGYRLFKQEPPTMLTLKSGNSVKTDTLTDGSVITMNKNSVITYPNRFTEDTREITLNKGEAFFDIAPDKAKPFLIHINDVVVKVVGTSFNIKTDQGGTQVVVETGKVQVIKQKVVVKLKPKETASISRSGNITKGVTTDRLYNYYRTNQLVADKTPLWRVVQILNEAYKVKIVIADKATANRPLSTTLIIGSLEQNLSVITKTFNLKTIRKGGKIIIQ